ncbi:MAG: hypothetical protein P4L76_06685 [Beijerinckiaceae bacterium]|nr:hypothetical protein [Beijerinckiaceae bacterium]
MLGSGGALGDGFGFLRAGKLAEGLDAAKGEAGKVARRAIVQRTGDGARV